MSTGGCALSDTDAQRNLDAAALVRRGRVHSLALTRFPGMPLFEGHPEFSVLTYRSPSGFRNSGDKPWPTKNEVGLGFISDVISGTTHTGAHIDAHGHMTIGDDDHWFGGNAIEHLGDFGPLRGDASELEPIWRRGLLYDVPRHRGVNSLAAGEPVTADELQEIGRANGIRVPESGDVVLVRTGYLSHWPDRAGLAAHRGAGPDISAADWLVARDVFATGSDTETYEVQPAPDPGVPSNPQPVHTRLLIEHGIYMFEGLYLEELAADRVTEFLFVALPLKIRGATGSMVDPIAVT